MRKTFLNKKATKNVKKGEAIFRERKDRPPTEPTTQCQD